MTVFPTILSVCIFLALLVSGSNLMAIPAPDPNTHAYKVAVAHFPLTDVTYKDPYAATQNRKIMISVFLPVPNADCVKECESAYMPTDTARVSDTQFFSNTNASLFGKMKYSTCCNASQEIDASMYPLVVLEPQVSTSRLLYSTLARHISANGAAVILVDHPYDASIVEFSYSRPIHNNGTVGLNAFDHVEIWNGTVTQAIDTRMRDIRFVLGQLGDVGLLQRQFLGFEFKAAFRTDSYTVVGHGLGGTTATTMGVLDPRVVFSINMSGSSPLIRHTVYASRYGIHCVFYLRVVGHACRRRRARTPQYFLNYANAIQYVPSQSHSTGDVPGELHTNPHLAYFFGRTNFRREDDIHWPTTWKQLAGKATEWDLTGASIFSFSDLPLLIDIARKYNGTYIETVRGLEHQDTQDFYATACFVAAYLKIEGLVDRDWGALGKCLNEFPRMAPYSGDGETK